MTNKKMRSKDEILGNISSESDYIDIAEALLDIRDILNERMPKYLEISGAKEETVDYHRIKEIGENLKKGEKK